MARKIDTPSTVVLAQIVADMKQVTDIHISTPVNGTDAIDVQPTLVRTAKRKVNGVIQTVVAETAPLAMKHYEGAALMDLLSDAYARATAHEKEGQPPAKALYSGIRDAVYARLDADNAWGGN